MRRILIYVVMLVWGGSIAAKSEMNRSVSGDDGARIDQAGENRNDEKHLSEPATEAADDVPVSPTPTDADAAPGNGVEVLQSELTDSKNVEKFLMPRSNGIVRVVPHHCPLRPSPPGANVDDQIDPEFTKLMGTMMDPKMIYPVDPAVDLKIFPKTVKPFRILFKTAD